MEVIGSSALCPILALHGVHQGHRMRDALKCGIA